MYLDCLLFNYCRITVNFVVICMRILNNEINGESIRICRRCGIVYRYNRDLKCPLCTLVQELQDKGLNVNPKFFPVPPFDP